MSLIIDSHVHVFKDALEDDFWKPVRQLRTSLRVLSRPLMRSIHQAQPMLRHFPKPIQKGIEPFSPLLSAVGILIESSPADLLRLMKKSSVQRSLVIAHPPFSSNEWVLDLCEDNKELVPVVNLRPDTHTPNRTLKRFVKLGAKALKIHPANDGEGPDSDHYRSLLKTCAEIDLPIILHTGCIHSHTLYKNPAFGHAEIFEKWFKEFSSVKFVLAHMNFNEPDIALDLSETYENLFLETSWQPAETIGEAVRRVGSSRVLYGSDWPIVGNNFRIGIRRISKAKSSGWIGSEDREKILGQNALKLFKLNETL